MNSSSAIHFGKKNWWNLSTTVGNSSIDQVWALKLVWAREDQKKIMTVLTKIVECENMNWWKISSNGTMKAIYMYILIWLTMMMCFERKLLIWSISQLKWWNWFLGSSYIFSQFIILFVWVNCCLKEELLMFSRLT